MKDPDSTVITQLFHLSLSLFMKITIFCHIYSRKLSKNTQKVKKKLQTHGNEVGIHIPWQNIHDDKKHKLYFILLALWKYSMKLAVLYSAGNMLFRPPYAAPSKLSFARCVNKTWMYSENMTWTDAKLHGLLIRPYKLDLVLYICIYCVDSMANNSCITYGILWTRLEIITAGRESNGLKTVKDVWYQRQWLDLIYCRSA